MSKPRAIVYVDGFNLYKGQLEQRPGNKWVDGKEKPPFTWHHVYKVQEKGSDVKLATQLLLDSMDDLADAYVVVSSDSDLSRPIEAAVARFGARVGVVYPRNEKTKLLEAAGIAFSLYLHPSVVARNQMPAVVRAGTRLVRRPAAWKEQGPAEAGP